MTDEQWVTFFRTCARVLGHGAWRAIYSDSWCAWTTFFSLNNQIGYSTTGLPNEDELASSNVKDGGTWGEPIPYQEIAHIVIPRAFYWESAYGGNFQHGTKHQDIDRLSDELTRQAIPHRKTDLILEIKLY
jgi:hypothetical protein